MIKIKHLLPVVVLLCGCVATATNLPNAGRRAVKRGITEGTYKEFYHNGKARLQIELKDSRLNGWGRSYYTNGAVASERFFINGKVSGEYRDFYATGPLKMSGQAADGLKTGWEKKFYRNGQVLEEIYYEDGIPKGESKAYYEDGQVRCVGEIEDGKFRKIREFDKNGGLIRETEMKKK